MGYGSRIINQVLLAIREPIQAVHKGYDATYQAQLPSRGGCSQQSRPGPACGNRTAYDVDLFAIQS